MNPLWSASNNYPSINIFSLHETVTRNMGSFSEGTLLTGKGVLAFLGT
jgi:hypothetical protein